MATRQITVGHEWQQITDGTQSVVVQLLGTADVCDSPTKPTEAHPAHNFNNTVLTITPPTVMWVRTPWFEGEIRVVIS